MAELQQYCMRSMYAFPVPAEKQLEYFDTLITLIEKQKHSMPALLCLKILRRRTDKL